MDDLPPLEPISSQATPRTTAAGSSSAGTAGSQRASNSSAAEPASHSDNNDVDMPSLERLPTIDPAIRTFERPPRDDDAESMPSLRSVSDPTNSSNESIDEVEMLAEPQPVVDDGDNNLVDVDDLPPLEPIAGSRRARVEDDEDDDRDRRHPTQRTNNATPNQQPSNAPPLFGGGFNPRMGPGARPNMLDLFQMFMGGAGPPGGAVPRANDTGDDDDENDDTEGPPFQFTFDMGDGPRQPGNTNNNNGGLPPGLAELLFPEMTPEQRANPLLQFQAVLERIGAIGQALGLQMEEEKEDPERAKKLVAGLELVPIGLVKRMEKVGGAPGGHVDDTTGEVEVPGCAICWDKLLDAEGGGFKVTEDENSLGEENIEQPATNNNNPPIGVSINEQRPTATEPVPDSSSDSTIPVTASDPSPSVEPSSTMPTALTETEEPKIVSLPCAHVFHASCLIPWFSRPRQTTCPTCRFNIDPENLTYIPRPRTQPQPQPPPADAAGAPAPAAAAADGNAAATADAGVPPPLNSPPNPGAADDGRQAFTALFGTAGPFEFLPVPPPANGTAEPGRNFTTGMFGPFFGGIRADVAPGAPQGGQVPPATAAPMGNMGGAPGPGWQGAGNIDPQGMFTFDVTLVTNAPFDGAGVPNMRRQTHVFANQFFGGNAPGPPPFAFNPGVLPRTGGGPIPIPTPRGFPAPTRERKQWTLPPAPGPTLRSRVEQREREVGLRCSDTSCGVGPSDEDPYPETSDASMKQLSIRSPPNSMVLGTSVCSHTFHPACLVSAERVAGWGGEDKKEEQVEVSCPNCRAVGCVERTEWEEGVHALV